MWMDALFPVIRAVSGVWLLATFAAFVSGAGTADEDDRYSVWALFAAIACVPLAIEWGTIDGWREIAPIRWGFPYLGWTGCAVTALGIALHFGSLLTLGRRYSPVVSVADDFCLIETGVYRFIRHPIYAGILLTELGFGLALSNGLSLAALLLPTGAAVAYRIAVEERALHHHLGAPYAAYAARTKRLIPGVF
jgi:protein-S-isoprenylcysteine O-methyltransferase Ste14